MKAYPLRFLLLSVLLTGSALASERFGLRGHVELGGSIDFTNISFSDSSKSTGIFSISPYVGFFAINQLEIGLKPIVTIVSPPSGNSTTDLAIFLAPSWNISSRNSVVTPFVEGLIGFSSADVTVVTVNQNPPPGVPAISVSSETVSGLAYGGRGGIKVQISDYGLLNFGLQYISLDRKTSKAASSMRENRFSVSLGFSLFTY